MNQERSELAQACSDWQGGRDTGSTPLRGAARVLTGQAHYFAADFISEQEEKARTNPIARRSAQILLESVNTAELRTPDEWNALVGLPLRGFAGRGLEPKPPFDDQIVAVLEAGTLSMPLWGVSLSKSAAWGFGTAGRHPKPRFMLTIDGAFPAVVAWMQSGEKEEEEELICGGQYEVLDISNENDDHGMLTTVRLGYRQPIPLPS